ncbi:MAG: signal recognition particle-docking protein FtsY [Hyphomicrobiales bacterium]|nr:MAG: signal recognition particle-docking protein FtsY [Hyphomicrobiales bacterium]
MSDKSEKSRGLFGFFRRGDRAPEVPPEVPVEPPAEAPAERLEQRVEPAPVPASPPPPVAAVEPPAQVPEPPAKLGWFQRLKAGLAKTSARLSDDISSIFTKRKLDADTLQDLEDSLIRADLGVETAMRITEALSKGRFNKEIAPDEVRAVLAAEVERVLTPVAHPLVIGAQHRPHVILVVGVNGTGKTTTIGKMAKKFIAEGRTVTIAAGDTFRAAAIDQLKVWGERTGAEVIARSVGADSAGLAYDALQRARENNSDVLLIDTAGRLQNKQALMDELEKVLRVLRKLEPSAPHNVLLVLDATTGQNALNQVEVFKERAGVTGLVMTKLDGTARGGILVAISAKFGIPVHAIGVGEGADDLQPFDAGEFARAIALS